MEDIFPVLMGILCVGMTILVPVIGIVAGRINESKHFNSIEDREELYEGFLVTTSKTFPMHVPKSSPPRMMNSEVVIASDYMKTFFASIRNFFGGEVKSYQKMLDRAKREAILRLIEDADELGYNAICNVRVSPADVGGGAISRGKAGMPMACVMASGTAYFKS